MELERISSLKQSAYPHPSLGWDHPLGRLACSLGEWPLVHLLVSRIAYTFQA